MYIRNPSVTFFKVQTSKLSKLICDSSEMLLLGSENPNSSVLFENLEFEILRELKLIRLSMSIELSSVTNAGP